MACRVFQQSWTETGERREILTMSHLVWVDVHRDHGSEDLLLEDLVCGRGGLHYGRLDEVADRLVVSSTSHDGAVGAGLGVLDVPGDPVESLLVDDGGHEGVGLSGGTNFERLLCLDKPLLDVCPKGFRYVHPGAGGALLSLVLKCRSDGGGHHARHIGSRVDKVVVLPSALADKLSKTKEFNEVKLLQ